MFMRIGLLLVLSWIVGLTAPLFSVLGQEISGRDLILIVGGLFLIWKSTEEIHQLARRRREAKGRARCGATFAAVIVQIMVIDIVFSLDSIITAVGMVDDLAVMIAAVVASVGADDAVRRRRSAASCPSIRPSRCWRCRSWSWSAWC